MRLLFALLALSLTALAQAPEAAEEPEVNVTFTSTTSLVVVDVDVKDGNGTPIENLSAADFRILEDGKAQQISVFEFQRIATGESAVLPTTSLVAAPDAPDSEPAPRADYITPSSEGKVRYRDRRLMVLFFDFSSMPEADQIRSRKAAEEFLDKHMTPADLVAIMAFSSSLQVLQDFTDSRELLADTMARFQVGEGSELAAEADTDEESSIDTGDAFVADESEFNIFNTDRKLSALESAVKMLASLPEKKAFVYFSSGVGKTGVENHSQLRSTVNAAVRSNVSFYPVDARGLVAEASAGNASVGSSRGTRTFSGAAQRQRRQRFNDQQDTLFTLAADTGGKAFLDSNDLVVGITQAQQDISSYYILGYYSSNPEEDGRFRRVRVELVKDRKAKLDYRSGYFGPKDFSRFSSSDKERQLEEALLLGDPVTDLTLALSVGYFRFDEQRYFVPVAVKIPGSEVELARKSGSDQTRFDFLAQVRDFRGALLGSLRDHIEVKLTGDEAARLGKRQLQYDAGFTLPPGRYTLKFLARENETGKMGTFETRFEVPDLDAVKDYAKMSSVVWANQREAMSAAIGAAEKNKKLLAKHPLIQGGLKLIPSITQVFRKDQTLYVYLELYDPGPNRKQPEVGVAATLSLYRGGVKAFESEPVRISDLLKDRERTVPVQFQTPLADLAPGEYICQISVIDELGQKFGFQRAPLVLLP